MGQYTLTHTERIIGPWEVLILGPCHYILCHVMLRESLGFVTKGGLGVLPHKKFLKIQWCNFMHFRSTKWIVIAMQYRFKFN